jgi:CRISPR/Cas system CSM-associated protein Csm4 (group 5 of RAMP superfamily)
MARFDRYRLEFCAPLHLAGRGVGIERSELTVRSDTLFSALCAALAATHGRRTVDDLLEWFREGLTPFALSSTFPWVGETFLLPRPRMVPPGGPARRARWLSAAVLAGLLRGEPPDDTEGPLDLGAEATAWLLPAERQTLNGRLCWAVCTVPRVTVDRQTSASAVYRAGRTVFGPDAGLYFLVDWRDRAWKSALTEALAYLAEAGLGGERSAGHGQFRMRAPEEVEIPDAPESPFRFTLALYYPSEAEIRAGALDPPAAYDLETRRGWMTDLAGGGRWRKTVRMLAEGALVKNVGPIAGELADVTPDGYAEHRVIRCGLTPTLGVSPTTLEMLTLAGGDA